MKIASMTGFMPDAARTPADWRGWMGQICVRLETDTGLVGYGMGGGGEAGLHVIDTVLRRVMIGAPAEPIEDLWEQMYAATLPFGRKGLPIMAISAVDLALWDLRAKAQGCSVAALLGEAPREHLPLYRTISKDAHPTRWLTQIEAALTEGYRSVKIGGLGQLHPSQDADQIVGLVAQARALVGDEVELMTDVGMQWKDVAAVIRLCQRLVDYNMGWLEEPLPADDLDGYARLAAASPIPIAGGEHEFTARGFGELMARGAHHIYQPDVCWCGGLTQLLEIYRLAKGHDVRVCPHRGSEAWSLPALQTVDPKPLAESGRPWMDWVGGARWGAGIVEPHAAVGFGVDEEALMASVSVA
ncbi:MAG: mandelate racemase/muconate lactonizing enzyme family protein [Gemmatimonadetes bacterium]|jgi:L-rhamnonate dehydratase|nr:mandelate racemase/muconate lactonizing enzyme family protein [Gemmatimonadota bacterium]MBT7861119.1 mandelate racemase/muconate lactonizing enzyme family protein [Gemmatimonadota bacterium]